MQSLASGYIYGLKGSRVWRCITIGGRVRFTLTFLAPPLIFPYFFFPCWFFRSGSLFENFFLDKSTAICSYRFTISSWHTHFHLSAIFFTLYFREIAAFFLFLIFTNFFTSGRRTRRVMFWYEIRNWFSFGTTWKEMRL